MKSGTNKDVAFTIDEVVKVSCDWLSTASTKKDRDNLQRFGITPAKAWGVSMANIQALGKRLGRDHELAQALWATGWYEARMLCAFVDEPGKVTPAQMDRWVRDCDNWGIVDTICFKLFDQTPHAWSMVDKWAHRRPEFERRAAYALIASLATHDKASGDAPFLKALKHIEKAATDERNFVKKGVSWALRGAGRRSAALNTAAVSLSRRLAASKSPSARWIGSGAVRELTSPKVRRSLAKRRAK